MKCKRCGQRVPTSHKGEFNLHFNLCRKCYAIKTSKYKTKEKEADDK